MSTSNNHKAHRAALHLIIAQLLDRGYEARPVQDGHKWYIEAVNQHGRTLKIKTKTKARGDWQADLRDQYDGDDFWIFQDRGASRYFIVPGALMRANIGAHHQQYLDKRNGHRRDNDASTHHGIREIRIAEWEDLWRSLDEMDE